MAKYSIVHGIRVAKCWEPEIFGRLTTIGPAFLLSYNERKKRRTYCVCQCACGEVRIVHQSSLHTGSTQSCGCLQRDRTSLANKTHGELTNKTHEDGKTTSEYRVWTNMRTRCYNPKNHGYSGYGGRGIKVCDRWLGPEGYQNFLADMGRRPSPQHSIDRIDVNGDYCPENCRWATAKEQANNKRSSRLVSHKGKTQTVAQWAHETGIPYKTLLARLFKWKWSVEDAMTRPIRRKTTPMPSSLLELER